MAKESRKRLTKMRGRARWGASSLFLVFAASACQKANDAPQSVLNPAGPFAESPDQLWDLTFGIAAVIFVLVEGALVFALIKFRHKEGRRAAQFHGNTKVEVVLTAIPALILAGIAVPTVGTIFDLAEEPSGALQVKVIAHQFWWEFQYPEQDVVTANELHIPVDTPVQMSIEGAPTDRVDGGAEVIHSFWIPRLGGTQDSVPGHTNELLIEGSETGRYMGQCKEYCGLSHANMRIVAFVQSQEDFDQWVSEQSQPASDAASGDAAAGQAIFNGDEGSGAPSCNSCHSVDAGVDAPPNTGPNLAHLASRDTFAGALFELDFENPENLAAWIRDPAAVKPGAKMPDTGLTDSEIQDVIAYLETLE
ncbi:MAG: cytochrome c oxidase subunit II [Actinomycetota bacterium]